MKKVVVMLLAILVVAAFAVQLKDVPKNHWAYPSIEKLAKVGILTGYPDGTFKGKKFVSRYELAVFGGRVYDFLMAQLSSVKSDVAKLKNDLASMKMLVSGITSSLTEELASVRKDVNSLQDKVGAYSDSMSYFYDQLDSINSQLDTMREAFLALKSDLESSAASKKDLEALKAQVNSSLAKYDKDILMLKKRTSKTIERLSLVEFNSKAIPALKEDISSLKKKVEGLEEYKLETISNIALMKQNLSSLRKGYSGLYKKMDNLNNALDYQVKVLSKKFTILNSKVDTTIMDLKNFKDSMVNMTLGLSSRVSKVESVTNSMKSDVDDMKSAVHSLKGQIGTLTDSINSLTSEIASLMGDVSAIKGDVAGVKKAVKENSDKADSAAKKAEEASKKADSAAKAASGANTMAIIALVLAAAGLGAGIYAVVK